MQLPGKHFTYKNIYSIFIARNKIPSGKKQNVIPNHRSVAEGKPAGTQN